MIELRIQKENSSGNFPRTADLAFTISVAICCMSSLVTCRNDDNLRPYICRFHADQILHWCRMH